MNYFAIAQEDLQKVANYLVTRPWNEVNPLVQALAQAKLLPAAPAEPEAAPAATTLQAVPDPK